MRLPVMSLVTVKRGYVMQVSILASGSKGNSLYIEGERSKILIDAGLSGKKIEERLASIQRTMSDIDAIFITHEHSDHMLGTGILAKRYGCDVYANEKTWQQMLPKLKTMPRQQICCLEVGKHVQIGDLTIESFPVSHDTVDPQFYRVEQGNKSFVDLTDTGYCSERLCHQLRDANMYLFEANHDVSMLRFGSYPWATKQRILGDEGHLCNEDAAYALSKMIGPNTKDVFLGHRSAENNMKALAREVVSDILLNNDIDVQGEVKLHDTHQDLASPLFEVI